MLLKLGVEISRLKRPCRRSLIIIEILYEEIKEEAIIVSTYEGNHGANSLHYCNDAYDIRPPQKTSGHAMKRLIKKALGNQFDVVFHRQHIHIEYDPKTEKKGDK